MTNHHLSISIPTYNRTDCIIRRLHELEDYDCDVFISDNSSSPTNYFKTEIGQRLTGRLYYQHNISNISGGANFLRSIESALAIGDQGYVWLRGDDDKITASQKMSVKSSIENYSPDLIILNHRIKEPILGRGIDQFSSMYPLWRTAGWLSSIVFAKDKVKNVLKWGYWAIFFGWANLGLVFSLFCTYPDLKFAIVPFDLSSNDFREIGRKNGATWSYFETCVHSFYQVLSIFPNSYSRRIKTSWRRIYGPRSFLVFLRIKTNLSGKKEVINPRHLLCLISVSNPVSSVSAVMILFLSLIPSYIYILFFCSIVRLSFVRTLLNDDELYDNLCSMRFHSRIAFLLSYSQKPVGKFL